LAQLGLARVLVHMAVRAEELAERRRACSVDYAELEVEEHRAGNALSARGLVVKHVDAVELRVIVAVVLAVAADAAVTALVRMRLRNFRAKKHPGGGKHVRENGREGEEKPKNIRVAVWHEKHEMPVLRARVSRTGEYSGLAIST